MVLAMFDLLCRLSVSANLCNFRTFWFCAEYYPVIAVVEYIYSWFVLNTFVFFSVLAHFGPHLTESDF